MNIKTFLPLILLFTLSILGSCSSTKPGQTPATVEDAEKMLAKQAKTNGRKAKKEQKAAQKHFWSLQSKEAKKSIKKNAKRNKRMARERKRNS
jgi:hypothetical protein